MNQGKGFFLRQDMLISLRADDGVCLAQLKSETSKSIEAVENQIMEIEGKMKEFTTEARAYARENGLPAIFPDIQQWKYLGKPLFRIVWRLLLEAKKPRKDWFSSDLQKHLSAIPDEQREVLRQWQAKMIALNETIKHLRLTKSRLHQLFQQLADVGHH